MTNNKGHEQNLDVTDQQQYETAFGKLEMSG